MERTRKENLILNFSRRADSYDMHDDIQRMAGVKLLDLINESGFRRILELGCGTGNYTLLLRDKFKGAKIKAVDISGRMIEAAGNKLRDRSVEFILSDAENLNLKEDFDLTTSNACFQWFENLEKALIKYKGILKKEGVILFSIFGPLTFWELDFSLKEVLRDKSVAAGSFADRDSINRVLRGNFKEIRIEELKCEKSFASLRGLLDKIKYTGIRGSGLGGKPYFGREALKEIERVYVDRFQEIKASYQIFFCYGRAG